MCKRLIFLICIVLVLGLTASMANADIIAYWAFDEGTGSVGHDVVGGFDAQLTSINWVAGQFDGSALSVTGATEVNPGPNPTPTTEDLTLAWWMVDNHASTAFPKFHDYATFLFAARGLPV